VLLKLEAWCMNTFNKWILAVIYIVVPVVCLVLEYWRFYLYFGLILLEIVGILYLIGPELKIEVTDVPQHELPENLDEIEQF